MIVLFDVETSDFKGCVIELGSVIITDSGERYHFNERCKPKTPISEGAFKTHGISLDDLRDCRWSEEVVKEWLSDICELSHKVKEEVVFCAHNLPFDLRMVSQYVDLKLFNKFCSLALAREALPDSANHKLGYLYSSLGHTDKFNAHSALDDCLMLEKILQSIMPNSYYEVVESQNKPAKLIPKITFGKHKGKRFDEVPRDYLDWIVRDYDGKDAVYSAGVALGKK